MITKKIIGYGFLAVVLTLALAACESPIDEPAHVHQWEWSVTTPATCIAPGEEKGVCKLDSSHITTREIAIDTVNGHDWDFDNATETKAPTCTTPGDGTIDCKRQGCGEERSGEGQIPIKPDAHNWKNTYAVTTPATCSAMGIETDICTLNGSHTRTKDIAIDPDAHNYQNYVQTTAPTCSAKGIDTGTCTYNNLHKDPREGADIIPTAHDWNTETGLCDNDCGELYYNLGDTGPGGGKIFYRIETGFTVQMRNSAENYTAHYLEAAPADMATKLAWASSGYIEGTAFSEIDIEGTATAIGTGRKNTALILAADANAPAAKACSDYSNGGKTDWFLPSKDELNQLYVNRTSVGNFSTVNPPLSNYSSSSQNNYQNYYEKNLDNGGEAVSTKGVALWIRAVRAF